MTDISTDTLPSRPAYCNGKACLMPDIQSPEERMRKGLKLALQGSEDLRNGTFTAFSVLCDARAELAEAGRHILPVPSRQVENAGNDVLRQYFLKLQKNRGIIINALKFVDSKMPAAKKIINLR